MPHKDIQKRRVYNNRYGKERYRVRKKFGVCTECGITPISSGMRCDSCKKARKIRDFFHRFNWFFKDYM